MTDILKNVLNIATRVHDMQIAGTLSMILFGVVLVFGLMNCILGYRLLRFWMMLFGFLMGAGFGLFGASQLGVTDKMVYAAAAAGTGVVLAVISFAVYKAGIFVMGAGIGLCLTIYVIHPTTSFSFFICLLVGVLLGFLAMRYEREVLIVGTSILGGILSGFSIAKLANMDEIPFGIIFSIGCALVGMLIQFAINQPKYVDDEDDEYEDDEYEKDKYRTDKYGNDKYKTDKYGKKKYQDDGYENDPYKKEYDEEDKDEDRYEDQYKDKYDEDEYDGEYWKRGKRKFKNEKEDQLEERSGRRKRNNSGNRYDDEEDSDDYEDTEEILDEYGIDEDDVIEEYLEDYYGENKKKKKQKKNGSGRKSASPYGK